jgi:hypothetical protein
MTNKSSEVPRGAFMHAWREGMSPKTLRRHIQRLSPAGPVAETLAKTRRKGKAPKKTWYQTQKEHWLGWLGEYDGPGAYGRLSNRDRTAEFVYNHIRCPPMLMWLAEASRVRKTLIREALKGATAAGTDSAACARIRRSIPWSEIEAKLGG